MGVTGCCGAPVLPPVQWTETGGADTDVLVETETDSEHTSSTSNPSSKSPRTSPMSWHRISCSVKRSLLFFFTGTVPDDEDGAVRSHRSTSTEPRSTSAFFNVNLFNLGKSRVHSEARTLLQPWLPLPPCRISPTGAGGHAMERSTTFGAHANMLTSVPLRTPPSAHPPTSISTSSFSNVVTAASSWSAQPRLIFF